MEQLFMTETILKMKLLFIIYTQRQNSYLFHIFSAIIIRKCLTPQKSLNAFSLSKKNILFSFHFSLNKRADYASNLYISSVLINNTDKII